jgi:hypothetical protein
LSSLLRKARAANHQHRSQKVALYLAIERPGEPSWWAS